MIDELTKSTQELHDEFNNQPVVKFTYYLVFFLLGFIIGTQCGFNGAREVMCSYEQLKASKTHELDWNLELIRRENEALKKHNIILKQTIDIINSKK